MNAYLRRSFPYLGAALFFTFALVVFASDAPPADDQTTTQPAETGLHEVGKTAPAAAAVTQPPGITIDDKGEVHVGGHHNPNDRVMVMASNHVFPGEVINGDAVAVMGEMTMEGEVLHDCVAVMGDNYVNGHVHGEVVAVMGDIHLGPHAIVDRDVTCVGGEVIRDPGSVINGQLVNQFHSAPHHLGMGASSWWHDGLSNGRLLVFTHETHFLLLLTFATFVLSLLLILAFPRGVTACGDALTHRTGATILTGFLSILALPFLFILLLVTVVGIPIALIVLPLAVIAAKIFGTAAILVLMGQGIFGKKMPVAVAFLIMAVVMIALFAAPAIGILVYLGISFLGFSAAVSAVIGLRKRAVPVAPAGVAAPAVPPVAPAAVVSAAVVEPTVSAGAPAVESAAAPVIDVATAPSVPAALPPHLPPPIHAPAASLPRAGFWIRMCALLIDVVLVGFVTHLLDNPAIHFTHSFLFWLAAYGAVLWKLKGSTVGDTVLHLKVVRIDDRPIDWGTACVRALGCFISLIALGLGFIWIAFDLQKQAWHDKIAGTVVVELTKAAPLV